MKTIEIKNKGFTILEILVVLSVIAILIGIAVPRFKGMQDEANITKAKSEMKVYQAAIESYKNNNGNYPDDTTPIGTTLAAAVPKITDALTDPFSPGNDYGYLLSDNGVYYVISSAGAAGDGTATDIADDGTISGANTPLYATNGPGTFTEVY